MPETRILDVLDDLALVVDATTPEQDTLPTPCGDFDVIALRRHLAASVVYYTDVLADPAGKVRPNPREYTGSDDAATVADTIRTLAVTARTAVSNGIETAPVTAVELAVGTAPGARVVGLMLAEIVVHGWDMSRATGRPWEPSVETTERAYAALKDAIAPEYRGEGLPFAPEVPVPATATPLERLLGLTGRTV